MEYFGSAINQELVELGFNVVSRYNAYSRPYDVNTGWPLSLPDKTDEPNTVYVVHFADFVTVDQNQQVLELKKVEEFYQEQAHRVIVIHWTDNLNQVYSGPVNLIKFSNHNYDICKDLSGTYDQWKYIHNETKSHAWQCLNGRIAPHRVKVAYKLKEIDNGWLSLGTEIPLPDHNYSFYFGCENLDNFMKLLYVYQSAPINIVTETQYDPPVGIITEKTQMAFAAQQIPIIIGYKGIIDQCRKMGFDMFDDLVDHSYDDLDNDTRWQAALERNWHLLQEPVDLSPYRERLQLNMNNLLWNMPVRSRKELADNLYRLSVKILSTQ
jgi:hypothetical protein